MKWEDLMSDVKFNIKSIVNYSVQVSWIFRICAYTYLHLLLKVLIFSAFLFLCVCIKAMKFKVQNNFIFLWRSPSWYVGGSCQLQHHCQGVEAFVQHASRRKWNLGKLWSDKALSVILLETEVNINCLLGHINLDLFSHVDWTYVQEVFLLTILELICSVVWKLSTFHCSLESTKMVVLTFVQFSFFHSQDMQLSYYQSLIRCHRDMGLIPFSTSQAVVLQ